MRLEVADTVYQTVGLNALNEVAANLVKAAGHINAWLFYGDMGSGKTTLVKAIGQVLGVEDVISSPTFSIVNEYETRSGKKIFHFDFYRIKNETEAFDIGAEEYFYSGEYCFIEWPEKIPNLLPLTFAEIRIRQETSTQRTIALVVHEREKENRI